jgi:cytochrome b6-f complex iron-sulfur subunit
MNMDQMNRREVLLAAAAAAAAIALTHSGLLADTPANSANIIDVGPKSNYSADGITDTWAKTKKIYIVSHGGRIYASTAVCTHKGCTVRVNATKDGYACPCHHATYDLAGEVTHKPATVALERYAIAVDANGHIIVDKSRPFYDDKWNDPASYVAVSDAQTQPSP